MNLIKKPNISVKSYSHNIKQWVHSNNEFIRSCIWLMSLFLIVIIIYKNIDFLNIYTIFIIKIGSLLLVLFTILMLKFLYDVLWNLLWFYRHTSTNFKLYFAITILILVVFFFFNSPRIMSTTITNMATIRLVNFIPIKLDNFPAVDVLQSENLQEITDFKNLDEWINWLKGFEGKYIKLNGPIGAIIEDGTYYGTIYYEAIEDNQGYLIYIQRVNTNQIIPQNSKIQLFGALKKDKNGRYYIDNAQNIVILT